VHPRQKSGEHGQDSLKEGAHEWRIVHIQSTAISKEQGNSVMQACLRARVQEVPAARPDKDARISTFSRGGESCNELQQEPQKSSTQPAGVRKAAQLSSNHSTSFQQGMVLEGLHMPRVV
jgi:hypothetical protein